MSDSLKDKSRVKLINAYILNNQVRAQQCGNCKCETKILVGNYSNPNLLLYGCKDTKCKHHLLRIDLAEENARQMMLRGAAKPAAKINNYCQTVSLPIPA